MNKERQSVLNNHLHGGTGANLLLFFHPNFHSLLKAETYRASVYSGGKEGQISVELKSRILSARAFPVTQDIFSCLAKCRILKTCPTTSRNNNYK